MYRFINPVSLLQKPCWVFMDRVKDADQFAWCIVNMGWNKISAGVQYVNVRIYMFTSVYLDQHSFAPEIYHMVSFVDNRD